MSSPSSNCEKPLPPAARAVARAVLAAFGYRVDKWTFAARGPADVLVFHVPPTETVTMAHFVAAREVSRRARIALKHAADGMRFVVRVPPAAAAPPDRKRKAPGASVDVHGNLDKKQRQK